MAEEKDAFYVVRKGDIIGIYRSLTDCQAQAGSSACSPPLLVYKGYCLPKEAEEYLVSRGLQNATYSISADYVKDDHFGQLSPCPFQQPISSEERLSDKDSQQILGSGKVSSIGPTSAIFRSKHEMLETRIDAQAVPPSYRSCILNFDGASKGNPGLAGAGAVLYAEDGSLFCRLREGAGISTNNVAEYRALILGLRYALKEGFRHIRVYGDSNLVCMQVQGLWKTKNQNMADLCKEAKQLKDRFLSFHISHIDRAMNSAADAEANLGVGLRDGQVQQEFGEPKPR